MKHELSPSGIVIDVESEDETERVGRALAELLEPGVVLGLIGPLGAGKTRLTRTIAESLGAEPGAIASPTFVLIHEYEGRLPIYHFDAYRLANADEFDALGAPDYWIAGGVCIVEWADRVADRLPGEAWMLRIEVTGDRSRRFELTFPDQPHLSQRLAARLAAV